MQYDLQARWPAGKVLSSAVLAVLCIGCRSTATRPMAGVGPMPPGVLFVGYDEFYDIAGNSARQLDSAMRAYQLSPERFAGLHEYTVRWSFRYRPTGTACELEKTRVTLSTVVRLPRWIPPVEASDTLRAQWATFAARLDAHEQGHRRIAVDAARQIHESLVARRAAQCDVLGRSANEAASQLERAHRLAQQRYDATTRHGATQGAVWPPRQVIRRLVPQAAGQP